MKKKSKAKKTVKKKKKVHCGYCSFEKGKNACPHCTSPVNFQNEINPVEISPDLHFKKISFTFDPKDNHRMWPEWIEMEAEIYIPQEFFDAKERSVLRFSVPVSEELKKAIYTHCRVELDKVLKKQFLLGRPKEV